MKTLCRIMIVLGLGVTLLAQAPKSAAEQPAKKENGDAQEPRALVAENFYKLNFVIYELEDGKRVNQRDYSVIGRTNTGPPATLKVGTRVPIYIDDKKMQYQYMDVGVEIRCALKESLGKLHANCDFNISSLVLPGSGTDTPTIVATPVVRNTSTNTWAVLTPGKPALISTIDDVNSKKRTQIEVTATRVD